MNDFTFTNDDTTDTDNDTGWTEEEIEAAEAEHFELFGC